MIINKKFQPKKGEEYFYPYYDKDILYKSKIWVFDDMDWRIYWRGLCFGTAEEAKNHAYNMLKKHEQRTLF